VVIAEVALTAVVLAAVSGSVPLLAATGVAAAVVVGLAFGRSGGRWWTETATARRRLRQRRAAAPFERHVIQGYDDRGTPLGIGSDRGGWFAAVAVAPWRSLSGSPESDVPLARLAEVLGAPGMPASAVQVVGCAVPAPHHLAPRQVPSIESYRQLAADLVGAPMPALEHRTWVAVRLDVVDAATAAQSRGGGVDGVHRAVAAAVGRVGKALGAAGLDYAALDPAELAAALRLCAGLEMMQPRLPGGDAAPVEEWTAWRVGGLDDVAFEVVAWPARRAPLGELLRTPSARAVLAVELRRTAAGSGGPGGGGPAGAAGADGPGDPAGGAGAAGGRVAVRVNVRVATLPARLPDTVRDLTERAAHVGLRLRRLDGWHGPAAYASAPTGGGPR
jgi:type VII secretion protein EccE